MSFNPDRSKQAKEITFSAKHSDNQLPVLIFNNCIISPSDSHKHFGMILDSKLNFKCHLSDEKISKANKGIGIIKRLYNFLPRTTLVNIYKSFVRPHLDVIYDNPSNETFCQMIESVSIKCSVSHYRFYSWFFS